MRLRWLLAFTNFSFTPGAVHHLAIVEMQEKTSDLRAVCAAVSARVVEQRSTQAFSQELPVVSQLLWTEPRPPPTPLQQELQLTLSSGRREMRVS